MNETVIIRVDANGKIGAGHFMRCRAIADAIAALGKAVLFVVSDTESFRFIGSAEYRCVVIEGSCECYNEADAAKLIEIAEQVCATAILVDSYAVNEYFFKALKEGNLRTAYIDDMYLYSDGQLSKPIPFDLDIVINYGFSASLQDYELVYQQEHTQLLIGPSFAPIRECFTGRSHICSANVKRVLITSGSTNPNKALERMVSACNKSGEELQIDVIVGKNAGLDISEKNNERIAFHRGLSDLSRFMVQSDIVVSSAGSTLYELAYLGVPTIALPVVRNQLENAQGFLDRGLGLASLELDWSSSDLSAMLDLLISDKNARKGFSARMRETVDGEGSERIARQFFEIV